MSLVRLNVLYFLLKHTQGVENAQSVFWTAPLNLRLEDAPSKFSGLMDSWTSPSCPTEMLVWISPLWNTNGDLGRHM